MFNAIRSILRTKKQNVSIVTAPLAPARTLYVIGDVHGRDDLLASLLELIAADASGEPHDLVTVGDYVDRGENSGAVLGRLKILSQQGHVTCLMGNHERMLLDFLDDPAKSGRRWIRNGGLQTLASFGVGGLTESSGPEVMTTARDAFSNALGDIEPWLRALPVSFCSGNVAVVHAGMDPSLSLADQPERNLIWGHPDFSRVARVDDLWVIHGHTIVTDPIAEAQRISIDTGAYATGRLTAAEVRKNALDFLFSK